MSFDEDKKRYMEALYQPDRSKKGTVDEPVIPLLEIINKHPDYYTTSSCSGRISLFTCQDFTKKYTANWLFVSHKTVQLGPLLEALEDKENNDVWFRQESFILHVCARDFTAAKRLVLFAQQHGFKHSGIIALTKRFIIEIVGVRRIAVPIVRAGERVVSDAYLSWLVELANANLEVVHSRIADFTEAFSQPNNLRR